MNTLSVLVVEDESDVRDKLLAYTKIFFDTVYEASNGREALRVFQDKKPNIVLTDINMPYINGIELVEKIRKIDKKTQIIIISAHSDKEYLLQAIKFNLVSYIVKPIVIEELKEVLIQARVNLTEDNILDLSNEISWNNERKQLFKNKQRIQLTNNEELFVSYLIKYKNVSVSYEDIHNHIYVLDTFSKGSLSSIVKRLRQKTSKEFVQSAYNFGYKIIAL
ncbi:MAG: response regulator [Helicobacteraceae bacterium]|nr:response regulator [Helicobacteraceae bacterium]